MNKGNDRPQYLSMDSFKKWMEGQAKDNEVEKNIIGWNVIPKVNVEKLVDRMEVEDGDPQEMAEDFHENGGVINEVDGKNLLIEVRSGTFILPKHYVKRHV